MVNQETTKTTGTAKPGISIARRAASDELPKRKVI
jgi:hypothetical protein